MTPLQHAITQLGVKEATGNNDGVPADRYNHGEEKAWCAAFVTWCFKQAGSPLPGNEYKNASVRYMEEQLQIAGRWWRREPGMTPEPGDIVFFANRGASDAGVGRHVGLVESYASGVVSTIEGNLSNAVKRVTHDFSDRRITGFARWA